MTRVSVIICTWNRADLLDMTLEHFARLRVPPGVGWELLVVNNNSTDHTDAVLQRHAGRLPLRRLFEPRPGKSFAANLALAEARSDLLLWTDDDIHVDPDWLAEYVAAARAWPDASYFGGTIEPLFSVTPPAWIRRHIDLLGGPYAVQQRGPDIRPLGPEEVPFGANMAFRGGVLRPGSFDPRLGPCKKTEIRGEEAELIRRLTGEGHRGVWVGTARVKHYIPPERLTQGYLWRYYVGLGRTEIRLHGRGGRLLGGVPAWALRQYVTARAAMWLHWPWRGARWVRSLRTAARSLGIIQECLTSPQRRQEPKETLARAAG
jgi:glycosyltransferase involved in cell wall biosynthesis